MNFKSDEEILRYFDNLKSIFIAGNTKIQVNVDEIPLLQNSFLYIHDFRDAKITSIRGIKEVLGWDYKELTTRELYEIIHEDDRFLVYDITRYTIETILQHKIAPKAFHDILCLTYRMETLDGQFKTILRQSSIIETSKDHIPVKALSICTDIDYLGSPPKVNFHSVSEHHNLINYEDYISKHKPKKSDVFTIREVEVLSLLAQGLTGKEISEILFISGHTVHKHIANMKIKTGTKNTTELIKYSIFQGVIKE